MDAAEYQFLKKQIEAEYRENLAALDRVYNIAKKARRSQDAAVLTPSVNRTSPVSPAIAPEVADVVGGEHEGKGAVMAAARDAIASLSEPEFGWMAVRDALTAMFPARSFYEGSVRQAVSRLVDLGEIEVVRQGIGRAPSVYRRAAIQEAHSQGGANVKSQSA